MIMYIAHHSSFKQRWCDYCLGNRPNLSSYMYRRKRSIAAAYILFIYIYSVKYNLILMSEWASCAQDSEFSHQPSETNDFKKGYLSLPSLPLGSTRIGHWMVEWGRPIHHDWKLPYSIKTINQYNKNNLTYNINDNTPETPRRKLWRPLVSMSLTDLMVPQQMTQQESQASIRHRSVMRDVTVNVIIVGIFLRNVRRPAI